MEPSGLKQIMDALRHGGHAIHSQFNAITRSSKLKGHHVRYMELIQREGPMTAKAICDRLHMDKGHTSRVLSELDSMGLICRSGAARGAQVALTEEGLALSHKLKGNMDEIAETLSRQISEEELQVFLGVAQKIITAFRENAARLDAIDQKMEQEG